MTKEIQRWGDQQQYFREPIPEENRGKTTVALFNPPRNPLAHLVALNGIYKGEVIKSIHDPRITKEAMQKALEDLLKTVLAGPLESIQFHFVIEGVTRSITHQMVRSRLSFFGQESLRFAVPQGDWTEEIQTPESLRGIVDDGGAWEFLTEKQRQLRMWNEAIEEIKHAYEFFVNTGMPAEEARDILPHAMPTRIHWVIDLRGLLLEAGKRTCTQAQFPWRVIFGEIAKALRDAELPETVEQYESADGYDNWQYELLSKQIRPACYQHGKCVFKAEFDRHCSIRDRVDAFAKAGVPSSDWDKPQQNTKAEEQWVLPLLPIHPAEWAADPGAARI